MFSPRSPLLAMICTPRNTDLRFLTYSELYIRFPFIATILFIILHLFNSFCGVLEFLVVPAISDAK